MCIGTTDLPLGTLGRLQSVVLSRVIQKKAPQQVFCSDLQRSIQTAKYLSAAPVIVPGLREMCAGEWDGLDFEVIQARWPELYEKRGLDPNYPIPGAEDVAQGQQRFLQAVQEALDQSGGDIAIVAHITVMQSLLCHALGIPPSQCRQFRLDHCSVTQIYYNGEFHVANVNERPHISLDEGICHALLREARVPERIICHCEAVARKALEISASLNQSGLALNTEIISSGALLHDIARLQKNHASLGADWLNALGYPEVSQIIRNHHDYEGDAVNEQAVVYLADKVIRETEEVTIRERFLESEKKCITPAAKEAHQLRYVQTVRIRDTVNKLCGKEVVM